MANINQGELNESDRVEFPRSSTDINKAIDRETARNKTLNLNGSSYSGVDIKVVVHRYDTPTQDLSSEINNAIGIYSTVVDELISIRVNVLPLIAIRDPVVTSGALAQYKKAISSIDGLEGQLKDGGYIQSIGLNLRQNIITAQQNPFGLGEQLDNLANSLVLLISGWKSQLNSLSSKQSDFISTKTLAELQTISISTFREKNAVRAFGTVGVKGYTRGPRTVAGSMIFTVFDRNVLFELLETSSFDADNQFRAAIKDQLPPLDITILFANEYGALSRMGLFGVEFVTEGQTMSIEDIILEDVCQFVARDVDPMTPVLNDQGEAYNVLLSNYNQSIAMSRPNGPFTDIRASDLRGSEFDLQPGRKSAAVDRFRNRQNPFI